MSRIGAILGRALDAWFRRPALPGGASAIAPEVLDESQNRCGRARVMTVFSPIQPWNRRPGGTWLVRAIFFFARRALRDGASDITRLSFIHFARWGIVRRIPDLGQPRERLRQPLFMFESNYNGTFDEYIDAFANILTAGMGKFWGTSYGFPNPLPVTRFIEYIHANELVADHYYSAYPTATTTMIVLARDLERHIVDLRTDAEALSPEQFAARYEALLTSQQRNL